MIRNADIKDLDVLIEIMVEYANSAPISSLHDPDFDDFRARKLFMHYITKGIVLLSEHDDVVTGMLLAGFVEDMWLPEVLQVREIAWYVKPAYRQSTDGYRLLKKYESIGRDLIEAGLISDLVITTMEQSPVDISKRGWKKIESNYILEGEH